MNTSNPTESQSLSPDGRRLLRRWRVTLAVLAIVALSYLVENWRGARAWAAAKAKLEARGEKVDWAQFVPKPVPDEQNAMKHPFMRSYGVRREPWWEKSANDLNWLDHGSLGPGMTNSLPVPLATLKRLPNAPDGSGLTPLPELLTRLTRDDALVRQFKEAIKRPHAQIDWNASTPLMEIPLGNYMVQRRLAQGLATRAKIHLLQGRPAEALADLKLIRQTADFMLSPALVSAMIRTAIAGLLADTVHETLSESLWPADMLPALQGVVADVDLLTPWSEALRLELVWRVEHFRRIPQDGGLPHWWMIHDLTTGGDYSRRPPTNWGEASWGQRLLALSMAAAPRGWYYQNMVSAAGTPDLRAYFDAKAFRVDAVQAMTHGSDVTDWPGNTPYGFLAKWSHPNFFKSLTTTARNQTRVNLAFLACALEQHRAAKGAYPETLAALAPDFATQLPHDLFDGQPPRYRRMSDGKFLLYSIGWNSRDDGGTLGGKPTWDNNTGDWVWGQGY